MMETMIPPQVGMRLRTKKRGQRSPNKKEAIKREKAQINNKKIKIMREKERRGNATILLPHLCFKVAPCFSYRESPI